MLEKEIQIAHYKKKIKNYEKLLLRSTISVKRSLDFLQELKNRKEEVVKSRNTFLEFLEQTIKETNFSIEEATNLIIEIKEEIKKCQNKLFDLGVIGN